MALVEFEINDFNSEVNTLITTQFYDKPVFRKYLELFHEEASEHLNMLNDLIQKRWIDTAEGKQLDIIGKIVGQERTLYGMTTEKWFGFEGHLLADTFGDLRNASLGGRWWSLGTSLGGNVILADEEYRMMIKAKIIKNNARGRNEDFLAFCRFVLKASASFSIDSGAKAVVKIHRSLSLFEKGLITYFFNGTSYEWSYAPIPLGVGVGVLDGIEGDLGFLGTPNAKGMVSLLAPGDGGIFASITF